MNSDGSKKGFRSRYEQAANSPTAMQQEGLYMKLRTATIVTALACLIFTASPAHALRVWVATIALGEVQVIGFQAQPSASITWENQPVTQASKYGTFHFSTPNLPQDCVGELSDGGSTIPVVIDGCTIEQVVGGGVLKTGQTTCYDSGGTVLQSCSDTGQDGEFRAGSPVPSPRFTDNLNGTITDNLTGLIWLKDASCLGSQSWAGALAAANLLANGACGLSDNSIAGDWRLPNRNELASLLDLQRFAPALPADHLFSPYPLYNYWSSTTRVQAGSLTLAWFVGFYNGDVGYAPKDTPTTFYVTAVRGGL
jgi:hypothetical protein